MFSSARILRGSGSRVATVVNNHAAGFKGGKMLMRQAALMSSNIVKSPFSAEKLSHPSAQVPIANFILKDFLQEDRKDLVSIIDGFSGKELTFTQVYYYTLSLTKSLKKLGYGPGDCIALVSPNHLHYMTSFLAISLTGAVSTCANPLYSETELTYQFEKTKTKAVITHPMCLDRVLKITPAGQKVIIMDDGMDCRNNETIQKLIHAHAKAEVLYMSELMSPTPFADAATQLDYDKKAFSVDQVLTIPFSSGTTGKSKGVLLTHKNLISNIVQADDYEDKSHRRIVVVPLPFFHIYGNTLGVLLSHYYGGQIIFMPAFDMIKFLEIVQKYKATRAFLVPPIILALAKHPIVDKYNLSTLTEVNSGAAPLGVEVQLAAAKRLNCIVKQGFGMTEASPMLAVVPKGVMQGAYKDKATSGVMVAGTDGKIIDPLTGEDLPPTSEGELLVRGPQVMKGYLDDDEANARTFTKDGFMRTGDIGFFDETGYLYLTDRAKELIKYKGMQVPPAELEAIIASIPQVKDCIVIPVPDEEAGEIPRAYVVKQDNAPADFNEKSVIDYVASKVAPHKKLRGGVFFTDNIPKAPSGKLLRRVQVEIDRKLNPVSK